ncbi:hypothetical protein EYF80_019446 [Liparis tanakae]|uniref:Uncharacterized protein n=1 Tax=Liparis tanakae TaxID=230148 RepID=A0A4Z2HZ52_9TELE|nr:hypothetical protein EYF80_019446 [Liparis tanakae]
MACTISPPTLPSGYTYRVMRYRQPTVVVLKQPAISNQDSRKSQDIVQGLRTWRECLFPLEIP